MNPPTDNFKDLIRAQERMKAYRQHLLKAGKLREAAAVARCILLVRGTKHGIEAPSL